jgi:S-formylglutathione hydrolase FrmB
MRGKVSGVVVVAVLTLAAAVQAAGTVTEQTFYSQALDTDRTVLVYLPEGYQSSGLDYPVIYFMHGADGGVGSWYLTDFVPVLDEMIADGLIDPMIIVEPDSASMGPPQEWSQQGFHDRIFHLQTDSALLGNNETYLAEDLVAWIDWNYRTLANRENRLLIGRSMGGHGAIRLALRHPQVFGGASIDAGYMAIIEGDIPKRFIYLLAATPGPPYGFAPTSGFYAAQIFAFCGAFAPNMANPPWNVDFILDENGEIDEDVHQRLLAQSPPALVDQYAGSEYPLNLFLRIGDRDEYRDTFWPVVDALEANDVPHQVRVFEGGHYTHSVAAKLGVHLTYFMPIKATAEISPRIADPRLHPRRLRVALELPGDLDAADIDCSTLELIDLDGRRLDHPVGCSAACEISDVNGNGRDDLSLWLPCNTVVRAAVAGGAVTGDQVELTVRGELEDGRFFKASDTVTLASDPYAAGALE